MSNNDEPTGARGGSEPVGDRVRIFQRGRTWYANFQHAGRQHRQSLRTKSLKEARRRALRIEAQLAENHWKPSAKPASLPEVVDEYLAFLRAEDRSKKTLVKYEYVFRRMQELARQRRLKDIADITLRFLDAYRQMRVEEGTAPKTRDTETVVIRQLVNFALSRDLLAEDPLKGLKLKKSKPTVQPCWTREQVVRILAASPDSIRPALVLLAVSGMRFAEMSYLTWEDVDLASNVLRIQPKDGWKPKTGDQRAIPIVPKVRHLLNGLPRRHRWVVTMPPSTVCRQNGRQWTERRLLSALKRVLKELELPGHLHTFRHSFISNALLQNTPVAVVRAWVGHMDEEVIKLYTHVHDSASQTAMQRLGEANDKPLQQGDKEYHGREIESAQNQHTTQESHDDRDAK